MDSLPYSSEALLAHSSFLHSLSGELLFGASGAEDVVQDTWVSALEQPPQRPGDLRGWLRRVATNHALDRWRAERSRAARERLIARPEGVPSSEEVVEREELRRIVVHAVLGLAEPYRSTLLLRFYENLPPRDVARRLGVPVETVRTRIKRGLARLRTELDQRGGGREAWAGLLLPLARRGSAGPRWWASADSVLAVLGAACALVALVWVLVDGARRPRDEHGGEIASSVPSTREVTVAAAADAVDETIERGALRPIDGELVVRVLRTEDLVPVERARLELVSPGSLPIVAFTDATGSGRLVVDRAGRMQLAVDPTERSLGWEGEIEIAGPEERSGIQDVLVPGAVRVSGSVLRRGGALVARAEILAFGTDSPTLLDGEPLDVLSVVRADERGTFELEGLPLRFSLLARADGLLATDCFVADCARSERIEDVVLLVEPTSRLRGVVRSQELLPVGGASVVAYAGGWPRFAVGTGRADALYRPSMRVTTASADDGSFSMLVPMRAEMRLRTNLEGYVESLDRWLPHAIVGQEQLEIKLVRTRERVLQVSTETGEPIAGAQVYVYRLLYEPWTATSDAQGRVVLPSPRVDEAMMVRVMAPGFGARLCPPIRSDAPSGVQEIRLPIGRTIRGRVLDASQLPLAGVEVNALPIHASSDPWHEMFKLWAFDWVPLASAFTSADGTYLLEGLDAGQHEIVAIPPESHAAQASRVAFAGDAGVDLVLGPGDRPRLELHMRVVDASSGAVLPSFGARIEDGGGSVLARSFVQSEDGVLLPPIVAGTLRIDLLAHGYAVSHAELTDVAPGSHRMEVALFPERSLRLRVVDREGRVVDAGVVRCRSSEGAELPLRVGPLTWMGAIAVRPHGETLLEGLPAQRIGVAVQHPLHVVPSVFDVDLLDPQPDLLVLTLPWRVPVETRVVALVLCAGERSEVVRSSRRPLRMRSDAANWPPGTHARVRILDDRGEIASLEWVKDEQGFRRLDETNTFFMDYTETGVLTTRVERRLYEFLPFDIAHTEENPVLRKLGVLFDAPREACHVSVSVDGCEEVEWELDAAVTSEDRLEIHEARLVQSR